MTKIFFIAAILGSFYSNFSIASEIKAYTVTENQGLNKFERIGVVENYLVSLSQTLQKFESKLDRQDERIKGLESKIETLTKLKTEETATTRKGVEKTAGNLESEIEMLKADILSLKNKDIDPLKNDVSDMSKILRNVERLLNQKVD